MNNASLTGDFGRKSHWAILLTALVLITDLKIAFACTLPGPWFLPDEVLYLNQAKHVASTAGAAAAIGIQPGWPFLLAPICSLLKNQPRAIYLSAVILSSSLATAAWIPAFLIARRWLPANQALAAALAGALSPGMTVMGWAALSEPLFFFLMMLSALFLVRAVFSQKPIDFAACLAIALLSLTVRPFGACCVLAAFAAIVASGVHRRRWREPLLAATICAAILLLIISLHHHYSGTLTLTNYPNEAAALKVIASQIATRSGWSQIAAAIAHDSGYLFVATFGVLFTLVVVGIVQSIRAGILAHPV